MSIKIIIADDHRIIRDGLCNLLDKQIDMEIVGEADNGKKAVQMAKELKPDVVIMDIAMPDLNGIEATRQIVADEPSIKIVALSMHSKKQYIVEILKAGASGYLLKDCAFKELAKAVRVVSRNQTYLSPKIADIITEDYLGNLPEDSSAFSILTKREREVLQLLAEGKATKQIANELHVSVKTIETHRRNTMKKLDINNVAELTKYAIREGITSLQT